MSAANITRAPLLADTDGYSSRFYQGVGFEIGHIGVQPADMRHWKILITAGVVNKPRVADLNGCIFDSYQNAAESLRRAAGKVGEVKILTAAKRRLQHPSHIITAAAAAAVMRQSNVPYPSVPATPEELAKDVMFQDVLPTDSEQSVYYLCQKIGVIKFHDGNACKFILDESLYGIFFELDALSDEGDGYWESRAECSEDIRCCIAEVGAVDEIYDLVNRARENGIKDD